MLRRILRVGDEVAWGLELSLGGEPWMPADWTIGVELQPHASVSDAVRYGQVVARTEQPFRETRHERVIFYEEHHADMPQGFPATSGAVKRIRVASVVFRDGQALRGSAALREVDAVPDAFGVESGRDYRSEVGVLVDFEPTTAAAP
jgi:uncharacterized protein DUF6578